MLLLAIAALLCALVPCILFCTNLRLYQPPPPATGPLPPVSLLIPARNEAHGIADAITAALTGMGTNDELIVMDDASTDATGSIVLSFAATDPRVRLEHAPTLPPGWNGKQHACWVLAHAARNPILCFVDADVRLAPEAIPRMAAFLESSNSSLVSGFPRQITGSTLEWLLLPLIHFVLLGFLPIARMRASTAPSLAAGCGQFLMCRRDDYFTANGHSGIKSTMHDGLRLPRLFREHGFRTDLADLTPYATCRMYTNAAEVWQGLAKNATEGLAAPARIAPSTLILLLGQVLPFVLLLMLLLTIPAGIFTWRHRMFIFGLSRQGAMSISLFLVTIIAAWLPRILAAHRFRQDWRSALLHPLGIILLLMLQWYALIRQVLRRPVTWKTRAYAGN